MGMSHVSAVPSQLPAQSLPALLPVSPSPTMTEGFNIDDIFSLLGHDVSKASERGPESLAQPERGPDSESERAPESESLAQTVLPISELNMEQPYKIVEMAYRIFPNQTSYINSTFSVTNKNIKRLRQLCEGMGIHSDTIPFSVHQEPEYSSLGRGMRSLVHEDYDKIVIEGITFYKGMYGRIIVLISLGVSCTVWSIFVPGTADYAPSMEAFPRFDSYQSFFNASTEKGMFTKACFIERTDISNDVLYNLENEYPFNRMNIPANGKTRIAVGFGLMIVVFMALGVVPAKKENII
jgi:hypothetical protein